MTIWSLRWCVLAAAGVIALAACSSGRSEAVKPEPQDSTTSSMRQDSVPAVDPSPAPEHPASYPDASASGCASCGPNDQCVNGRCVCQPLTCASGGKRCGEVSDGCGGVIDCGRCSRCGPDEMDCCGTCIPKTEQRCPENVHCPTSLPER
jgi:hypothetical protein